MPLIALNYHTSIADAVGTSATAIRVAPNQADLCETVTTLGKNVVLTIFNAKYSELVLATGCEVIEGVQHVTVQRGFGGTTARDWPLGTCICASTIMDACAAGSDASAAGECHRPLAGVVAGGCVEIIDSDTCTPTIRLRATGVTPTSNACIRVNECGIVEWVSPNFPYDCLPVYEDCSPCASCNGSGGSGATTASSVSFNGTGNQFAVGPTVSSALTQLDLAMQSIASSITLAGIIAGDGIDIDGSSVYPTISLAPVTIAGEYSGFTINEFGQILSYDQAADTQFIADAPLTVTYNGATNTYTFTVDDATVSATGVVQLVDEDDVVAGAVPSSDNYFAVTWAALLAYMEYLMPVLDTGNGIGGSSGVFNTARTIVLNLLGLSSTNTVSDADFIPYVDGAGSHARISVSNASREFGGAYASAVVSMPSAAIVASKGISSIVHTGVGFYTVTMAIAGSLPTVYIVHATAVNHNTGHYCTYRPLSASTFELRFFDLNAVAIDPAQVGFTVVAAG